MCRPARSAPDVHAIEIVRRIHEQPEVVRRIAERLEHRRGVRAERSVDEPFERADAKPVVAAAVLGDDVSQPLPRADLHGGVDARAEIAASVRALEDGEVVPRAHVMDRRHAVATRRTTSRRRARDARLSSRHRRQNAIDELLGVVFEDAGRFTALRRARSCRRRRPACRA